MTLAGGKKSSEKKWEDEEIVVSALAGEDVIVELKLNPEDSRDPQHFLLFRGDQLMPSERYSVQPRGNVVQLTLKQSQKDDTGQYSLVAKKLTTNYSDCNDISIEGVRKKIRMNIREASDDPEEGEPPIFVRRLTDLAVKVGTRTRFLVEIRSSSSPKVTWHRNDQQIQAGSRFSFVHEGNFYCVDVAPVMVEDQGHWTCMVENVYGRSSCVSCLSVIVPKAYKRPEFVEELRAILTETGTVSLECKVIGVPTPVLRWFKDSKEIKAGDVFALTANADDPTSLGTYTCQADNCMGTAYSSSKVHVVGRGSREGSLRPADTLKPSGPLPVFKKILNDECCRIGDTITLTCQVQVPPWPKVITWYNKEGKVEPSEKYHEIEDGLGTYSIEIRGVEAMDEGEWKCVATSAENVMQFTTCYVAMSVPKNYRMPRFMESLKAVLTEEGLVSFECKVVGFPTPFLRWFKDGQELKPGDVYQLTGTNSLGSYCCIARNCMGEAKSTAELTVEDIQNQLNEEERLQLLSFNQVPKFIKGLRSCEARIHENFTFTVQVTVSPKPTLSWFRDDELITSSDKYKIIQEVLGNCHLEIQKLEFSDQAEWKCIAENDFGHSITSCFLKLIIPRHFKKPKFLESLRAILSEEGAVNLECKVIGVPQPVLKWYKDGAELKPGDIHRIISGQDGTCCLGTYTCEATNCMGSVSSSASLLGFEDRVSLKKEETQEPVSPPLHELARNLSLSTIHEERTSQLYDTPQTDHSITMDDRGEVSFSFDGKEVSVSLYETPDLTEEEAIQIVEMYADQLSEHITEGNIIELPPMRFMKETSTSGNLLMEAVVIDVSSDYFVADEEADDLRTEADVEDVSIMDDQMHSILSSYSSPLGAAHDHEHSGERTPVGSPVGPPRPPRKKERSGSGSSKSEKSEKSQHRVLDWSESYHSAKEPSIQAQLSLQSQDSVDAFADALSSDGLAKVSREYDREIAAIINEAEKGLSEEVFAAAFNESDKKKKKKRSKGGTPMLSSKTSSEESFTVNADGSEVGKSKRSKEGRKRDRKDSAGSNGSVKERGKRTRSREVEKSLMIEDIRVERSEEFKTPDLFSQAEIKYIDEDDKLSTASSFATAGDVSESKSTTRSQKERLYERIRSLKGPVLVLRETLIDLEGILVSSDDENLIQGLIIEKIVRPIEDLCEQMSVIESKAVKSAGDRSFNQGIRISLLDSIGGPTEELLRGIELIKRHRGRTSEDLKSDLIVLESLTDPVDEILAGLAKIEHDLRSKEGDVMATVPQNPIVLERTSRAVCQIGDHVDALRRNPRLNNLAEVVSVTERLEAVYKNLSSFVSSLSLNKVTGVLESNVDVLFVETLVKPLEGLSRALNELVASQVDQSQVIKVDDLQKSISELKNKLETLNVALETYEAESGERGVTEGSRELVGYLKWTMEDAFDKLVKLQKINEAKVVLLDDLASVPTSSDEEAKDQNIITELDKEDHKSGALEEEIKILEEKIFEQSIDEEIESQFKEEITENLDTVIKAKVRVAAEELHASKRSKYRNRMVSIDSIMPELDESLPLPEMLLDPLIDVQAKLNVALRHYENEAPSDQSSLSMTELSGCLIELRESVASAVHVATTLNVPDVINSIVELREPLLDLQLALASGTSAQESSLIEESARPLNELNEIISAVIRSSSTSEASQVILNQVSRMMSEILEQLPEIPDKMAEIVVKMVPIAPSVEVEQAALALGSVHYALSTAVEKAGKYRLVMEDTDGNKTTAGKLVTSIDGLRQSIGNLAVAISSPLVPEEKAFEYDINLAIEELGKLQEPLLSLQKVLLIEKHDPEERHVLNDITSPLKALKEAVLRITKEKRASVVDLLEDVEKDVALVAMEALKVALVGKVDTESSVSDSAPGEVPGIISKYLDPIENWLSTALEENNEEETSSLVVPVIDELKKCLLKIVIQSSYSEPPSDTALIEKFAELKEPLMKVRETIAEHHEPDDVQVLENLVQPTQHLLQTILETSTMYKATSLLQGVIEVLEELENQIGLSIKMAKYAKELRGVVSTIKADEFDEEVEKMESCSITVRAEAHEVDVTEVEELSREDYTEEISDEKYDEVGDEEKRIGDEELLLERLEDDKEKVSEEIKSGDDFKVIVGEEMNKEASSSNKSKVGEEKIKSGDDFQGNLSEEMNKEASSSNKSKVSEEIKSGDDFQANLSEEMNKDTFKSLVEASSNTSSTKLKIGEEEIKFGDDLQANLSEEMNKEAFSSTKSKIGEEEIKSGDDLQVNLSEEMNKEEFESLVEASSTSLVKNEELKMKALVTLKEDIQKSPPLVSLKEDIEKSPTLVRSEELDLWTLTILNPLDRLAASTLALDRSIDEKVHELLCRPLDSLHKQIELVESQINRPAGQSLENDVETIIEGFLSPLNQVETALITAATEIWHEIPLEETVKKYLQDLAESSSDLCKQLDSLRRKLITEAPEQIVQVQKTEASLIETISAVIVPLEGIQEFIVKMLAEDLAKEQIDVEIQDRDNFSDANDTISKKDVSEVSKELLLDQDDKSEGDIKQIEKTTARPLEELIEAIVDPASVRNSTTPDDIEEIDGVAAGDEIEKDKEEMVKFEEQDSEIYKEVVGPESKEEIYKEVVSPESKEEIYKKVVGTESKEEIYKEVVGPESKEEIYKEVVSPESKEEIYKKVVGTESKEEIYKEKVKEMTLKSYEEIQESVPTEISSDIVQDLQQYKLQVTEVESLEELTLQQGTEMPVMDSGDSKEDNNGLIVQEVQEQTVSSKEDDVLTGEEMVEGDFVVIQENSKAASEILLKEEVKVVKEEIEVVKEELEVVKEELEVVKEEISSKDLLNKVEGIVRSELDRQNATVLENEELIDNVKVAVEEMMVKYPQICQVNVFEESVRDVVVEELQKMKSFQEIEKMAVVESDEFSEEKIREIIYDEISKQNVKLVDEKDLLEVVKGKVQQVILQAPKVAQMLSIEENIREIVTEELHKFEGKVKAEETTLGDLEVIAKEEMSQKVANIVAADITDEKVDELVIKELQKQRVELSENKLVDVVKTKVRELVVILPEVKEETVLEENIRNIVAEELKKVALGVEDVQNLVKAESSSAEGIIQPIVGENFEEKVKDMIVEEFKRQEFYPIEDPLVKEIKIQVQEIVLLSSSSSDDRIKEEILGSIVSAEVEKQVAVLKDVEGLSEAKQSQETAIKVGIDKEDNVKEEIEDLARIGKEEQAKTDIQKEKEHVEQKQGVLKSFVVSEDMIREELKKQDLYPVEDPLVKEIKAKVEEDILLSSFVPEEMVQELISVEVNKHVAELKEIEVLNKAKEVSVVSQVKKEEVSLNEAKIEKSDVKDVKSQEEIKSIGISEDMIREELKKQNVYPVEDPLVKEIKAKVQEEIFLSSHTTEENIPEEIIRDLVLVEVEKHVAKIKEVENFGSVQDNLSVSHEEGRRKEDQASLQEEAGISIEEDESKEGKGKKQSDLLQRLVVSEDMIRNELKKQQLYPVEDPLVKDIKTKVQEVILMSSHTLEENIPDEIIRELILVEIEKHVAELKYDDSINEVEGSKESIGLLQKESGSKEEIKDAIGLLQKESVSKEEIKDLKEKIEKRVQKDEVASQKQIVEPKDIVMETQVLEQEEKTAIVSQYTISEEKIHELVINEIDKQNAKSIVDNELKNKITLEIQKLIISRPEIVKEETLESSVGEIVREEIQRQAKLVEEKKKISEDVVHDIIIAHLKKQNVNTSEEADILNTVEEKVENLMGKCPEMCTVDVIEVTLEEIVRETLSERATSQKLNVLTVSSEIHEEVPEETIHEMVIDEVHRKNIEPTEEYRIIERIEAKIQQLILQHPEISGLNFLSEKVHDFVEEIVEEDKAEVVEIEKLLRAEEDKREIEVLEMPLVSESEKIVEEEIGEKRIKAEAKDVDDSESKISKRVITVDTEVCEVQKDEEVVDATVEEEIKKSLREVDKKSEETIEVSEDKIQEENKQKIEEIEDKDGGKINKGISEKKKREEIEEMGDNDKIVQEEIKNEFIEIVEQVKVEETSKKKVIESEDKIREVQEDKGLEEMDRKKEEIKETVINQKKGLEEMDVKKEEEIKETKVDQKKEKVQILRVPSETHAHIWEEMVHEIIVGEIHKLNIEPSKEDNLIKAVEFKVQDLIAQFPELSKEEVIEENVKHIVAEQLQEERAKASEFDETMDKAQVETKVEVLQTPATTQIQIPEEMVHDLIIEELQKQDVQILEENNLVKAIESKVNDLIAQHPEVSREEIIEESVREIVTEKLQEHRANVLEAEKLERAQADELKKKVEVLNVPALTQVEVPEENVRDMIIEGFNKQNIEPLTHENLVKAVEAKIKDLIAQHPDIRKSDVLEENVRDIITEAWAEERASVVEQEKLAEVREEIVNKTEVEVLRMPDEPAKIIEEIDQGVDVKDALKVKRKSSDKGEDKMEKDKREEESPKDKLEKSSKDDEENKRASVKIKSRKSEVEDKGVEDKNRDSIKGRKKSDDKNKEEIRRTSLEEKTEDNGEDVDKKRRESLKKSEKSEEKNDVEEKRRSSLKKEAENKKEIEEKTRDSLKKKHFEELGDENKEGEKRRTSLEEKAEDNDKDVDKKRRKSLKKSEKNEEAEKKKDIEEKTRDSLKKKHSEELGDKNEEEKRRTSLKGKDKDIEEKTRDSLKKKKQSEESDDKSKGVEEKRRTSLKEKVEDQNKDVEEKRRDSLKKKSEKNEEAEEKKEVEEKTRDSLKKKHSEELVDKNKEEKRRTSLKDKDKDIEEKTRNSLKKKKQSDDKSKDVEEKRRTSLKEKAEDMNKNKDVEEKRRDSLKKKSVKSEDKDKNQEEEKRRTSLKDKEEKSADKGKIEEKRRTSLKEKDESNDKDADKKRRTSLKKKSEKSVDNDKGVEERRLSLKMKSEEKEETKVRQLVSQKTDKESKIIDAPKEEKEGLKKDSIFQLDKPVVQKTDEKSRDTKEEYQRVNEDNQVAAKQPDLKLPKATVDSELDSEFSESSVSTLKNVSTKERYKRSNPPMIEIDYDESSPREPSRRSNLSRKYRDLESIELDDKSLGVYSTDTSRTAGVSHGPRDRGKKPSFCTKLTDRTAAESSRIKLTCAVLGEPEPAVYWLKDGKLLPPSSNRHGTTLENGMASLELYTVRPSDTGEYSCIARNPHGQACTEAKLKVYAGYEPTPTTPTFTRTIKDTYLREENTLVLECRVRGQPTPAITWLKDGQVLEISDRYQQCDLPDGLCRLKIFNPDFYDSGLYTCRAENDTKLSDRTSHLVDFEATGRAAQSRSWRGNSYNDITSTEKDTGRPRFSSYLTDHSVPVGGTIALQVEVKGVPPPDVTWMRADKKGSIAVPKARTFADSGVYTLIVPDATEYETGTYVCRASNSYGHVDSTATVEVVSGSMGDGGKPAMFVSRPPDKVIIVAVGEDVSVSFRTNGIPKPKVIWMKGLRDITSGPRSYKEGHDDYVRLTLKRACPSDEGTYCILVKNRYGCDRSFFSVQVKQRARSLTPSPDWGSVDTDSLLANIHDKERSYLKQVPGPISTEPVVIDGGRNWLALTWGKAEQRGSAPVVAYRVDGWLLGGEGGARWVELGVTPINAFDAFNLRPGEEYKFRITPRNRYGWGESVTMTNSVTVREVVKFPEFTKILPGQLKALEKTVLSLDCEVSSDSLAHVKWYRDTTEIENGQDSRFTTYFNGTKCTLMIGNISENDSGRYVCEATNAAGRVSTFARVQVVEDPKIVEADLKLRKMRSSDVANEERPPEFTMRLRDRRVQATYPVRLTCQVTGYPEPEVTWYKYREELYSQENISIWNDEAHFHTLEINRSTIDDSGIYMARAKNIYGSVSCRCHLTVDKGIRAYIAPEFLRHLDSIYTVKAGGELRMTAQIEAYPTVGVTWHRDGHRLRPSRDVVMTLNHDGSVELDLAHVTPRDAGLYCCTATNEVGQAETTTRVTVLDNDDIKSSDINQSAADESLDIPYSKEPVFVTKPLSTEAFEGDTVIISCEVVGDPKPEVIWLRDFLRPDYYKDAPHFRRVGAGPQYRLEIPYAKLDFTGTYSIIAKNCHGEAKAVISLQIYARGQGKEDSGMESTIKHGNVQTLPVIKRPLRDLRCCDGDAITLVCKLHAKPEPDIRWEKGGKLLPLGGDFATDFDGETARLSIQHVYPEDEGEYTCVAYNELGKAYTSACVIVDVPEGKETALSRSLIKPPGFLSANSTPISTPRSTPVRSLSPSCCKREVKPVTKTARGYTGGRRPRMPTSPKFYAVPHNKVAEEGETVRFQCAIAGHPVPWVTWDKDGISITPTARISLKESDDVRILEITEITHEDAGLYRVTLENDVGRTEATARLEIIKGRRSSISRPIRTRSASPRTYSIYGGRNPSPTPRSDSRLQPPRISDNYSGGRGTSPTLPRWHYRNGNAVNDEKINAKTSSTELNKPRSSSVPRHCKMEREKSNVKQVSESPIKNRKTRPSQHVTSPTQSSARKTSIPVRRKSSVKLNSNKQDKIDSKDKEKNCNSKDKNLKKKVKEELKSPVILTVPADIIALRGAKVMLLATYDGYPRPTVRWLRKGRDVTLDDKTEIETSAGLTCLTLLNVTTEEAGKYEVFIENKLGKDSRHVNVTVEGPPEPPAGSPAIQIIKDSRGVTLSWRSPVYDGGCAVTGYSVEMRRGEEPCWVAVAEAKHSLSHTISGLDPEESYQFRVRAENIHGLSEPGMESETVIITKSETRKITSNISGFSLDPDEDTEDKIEPAYEPCVVAPEPGFLFDERYNVLEELGKGKYGVVRRIVDKSNGSSFAAKFIRTIKAKDRQQVNDEINIMNMLRHPKLLRLIAAFESPREMIMVTEYISGGELFERVVADDFTLTEKDSILFVRQICMGVDYMHDNLVVHLDLKPENIMCHTRTSHRIKLIDFGLAQTLKPDTPVRVLFGTPEFIPPEIIGFEPIGTESDMWSVGVICYVLLTGLSPFMGENDAETFANITRADFDFDDKAFSAISEEAKDFISGLLIKRKELRMSAKECLKHPWLAQRAESMSRVALPTDKLKKFIVRRKWQKTGNAIRALGRMAILSANSRKNTESLSDVTKESEETTPTNEDIIITEDSLDEPINTINLDNLEFSNGRISKADSDELQITELSSDECVDSHDIDNYDSSTIIETQRSISPDDFTKIEDKIDDDLLSSDFKKIKIISDDASNKTDTFISELNSSEENIYTVDISTESLKTTTEIHEEFSENYCSITSLHINEPSFEVKEEITISRISLQDKEDNKFVNLIDKQNLKSKSSIANNNDNDNNNDDDKVPATRPNFIPIESNTNSHGSVCKPWCKTNSSSLDNEEEISRVRGHSPLHRVVRTGSVSRTAKMFEQEQVSSSVRQQLSPGSRIVLPAANARPHNERVRKAFAFWNK
ncbi:titin homolog isoform X4 [Cotesia glomerata]|uniref:titin homolog isoform X4 n=1 Tax=Cotesia glomerata TaxID=32391 RepID=UPI001D017F77|nr:titin homolog isoform X4 [Cotesia glomerata]